MVFHKNIEKIKISPICLKGDYPKNISNIISDIENSHKTKLKNFMIMAPSKLFKIKSPDDPHYLFQLEMIITT